MNYVPAQPPTDPQLLAEFLRRELQRLSTVLYDAAAVVQYRTISVNAGTLSAGISANWKIAAGNVVRISSSVTVTLTGLVVLNPSNREMVLVNVGTGVVVLNSQDAASSASSRFALVTTWQLSAGAAAVLWYDAASSRWRGISKT
jgi:hypothetical protein